MTDITTLVQHITQRLDQKISSCTIDRDEITLEVPREQLRDVCQLLRDDAAFKFDLLLDVCGVDYLEYGLMQWQTQYTTATGFSRGVEADHDSRVHKWDKPRFAVVYHLLSIAHNHRVRLRTFAEGEPPIVDSVVDLWPSANWYEREAFDLFGILFDGHPDLRRILTDYGFIGHPFRKDFPLIGEVEMRYDAKLGRCVYEPVSIVPRTLVPKVIRDDSRYIHPDEHQEQSDG